MYKQRNRKGRLFGTLLVFLLWMVLNGTGIFIGGVLSGYGGDTNPSLPGRHLLQADGELNCTPRSIEQFPDDFLTQEQRKDGGIAIHILIALYIFATLAIICDDYFVPALEKICEAMNLQPDVAGATFMAAGSSSPELFASVIGLFFAKSDVGVSTIVGSAVFNVLFTIAMCGLFSGMIIYLTWWPVLRDSLYYMISVAVLVVVLSDSTIHWYEATVMVVIYLGYIVLMYFNPRLGGWATHKVLKWQEKRKGKGDSENSSEDAEKQALLPESDATLNNKTEDKERSYGSVNTSHEGDGKLTKSGGSVKSEYSQLSLRALRISLNMEKEGEYVSPLTFPRGFFKRVHWVLMLPASLLLAVTVPDIRRPGCWARLYAVTFINSLIWIAGLSYIMVWMVTIVGDTFGVPDTVMGLTLLAAGTSVPDSLASLFVARDGYGDMAVSNCIGSNVFDIMLCLGLPWLIQTAMVDPNSTVKMNSSGLTFSVITLLGTVIFLVLAIVLNGWKLNKKLGLAFLLVYVVVITFSCLYELNIFGDFNPPPCPRVS